MRGTQVSPEGLNKVLSIGHDTSMRGEGISLREALARSRYVDLRPRILVRDIAAMLEANPSLVSQWIMYCEDKRTSGGWYINPERLEVGRFGDGETISAFEDIEEAVAFYVLKELDYWARFEE